MVVVVRDEGELCAALAERVPVIVVHGALIIERARQGDAEVPPAAPGSPSIVHEGDVEQVHEERAGTMLRAAEFTTARAR